MAVNLSQQKSSLKTPDLPNDSTSRSTILNPNTGIQPKISPHVRVNSSQNSSLEILASRFTISGSKERTDMQLMCPFECGAHPFKTQSDQKHHLMKKHACTDKQLTLAAAQSCSSKGENGTAQNSSSKDPNDDSLEEREANEKNIRKTYLSNTKGLMLYKFRKLLRENDLHEVLVCGNGYCFLSCIIIALAEYGIKKTLEVLSTEVMSHIRENKDFYSSFECVPQSETESENLIECCARYFQGAAYNTDSVDVCIAAIVKTLGVNLNIFMKDPVTKLMTLSKYDCNEYNSTVNLFLHYYPGSKQGKFLDAHYNCYVNTQYYKQNASAISSMMVKTIDEEEVEKALKKTKKVKGKTDTTLSTNVQSITEPQKEEAKKTSQKQKKSDASSSQTRNLQSSTQTAEEEKS